MSPRAASEKICSTGWPWGFFAFRHFRRDCVYAELQTAWENGLDDWRVLKERHLKFVLRQSGSAARINAIYFSGWTGTAPAQHVQVAYRLVSDDYRGGKAIQLIIEHCEPVGHDGIGLN